VADVVIFPDILDNPCSRAIVSRGENQ